MTKASLPEQQHLEGEVTDPATIIADIKFDRNAPSFTKGNRI